MAKNQHGPATPAPSKSQLNKPLKKLKEARKAEEAAALLRKQEEEQLLVAKAAEEAAAAPVETKTARQKLEFLSGEELDQYAAYGVTLIHGKADPSANTAKEPRLKGGWRCKWLILGDKVSLILLPGNEHTQYIWRKGQVDLFMGKGMTRGQATAFVEAKVPHKHQLVDLLIEVLHKPILQRMYLALKTVRHRREWLETWGVQKTNGEGKKYWDVEDGLNAAKHEALVDLIQLCLRAPAIADPVAVEEQVIEDHNDNVTTEKAA